VAALMNITDEAVCRHGRKMMIT